MIPKLCRSGERRARTWPVLVVALVLLGLVVWFAISRMRSSSKMAPDEGQVIATAFLEQIQSGQIDSAWENTTADFKSFQGLEELHKYVDRNPELKSPAEFAHFLNVTRNNQPLGECTFRAENNTSSIKVLLGREGGQWKVEHLVVE